jgi:ABC-type multidrug transport system ATPase subunit
MKIELKEICKRYGSQTILSRLSMTFLPNHTYAILGANGSGKTTLLKIITGMITPTTGLVSYQDRTSPIAVEEVYRYLSICAPYLELPAELTLRELIAFHCEMRSLYQIDAEALIDELHIDGNKQLREMSSGMRQRIHFALAYYTDSRLLLLDEPTATMDAQWSEWYRKLAMNNPQGRTIIIFSNDPNEYDWVSDRTMLPAPI